MLWEHGNQIVLSGRDKFARGGTTTAIEAVQILGPYDVKEHGLGNWLLLKFRWHSGVQVHVGGGRSSARNFWCLGYDELLEQPSEHLWQTVPHRSRHSRCACKSGVRWKGVFCVRPAYYWSQKQNDQVIANASLFETEQKVLANTGINASVWTLEL